MRYQAAAWLTAVLLWGGLPARAQEVAQTATPTVIRSETRLVLVDSVVMDKKGAYVGDLARKDFKVYEDGKEQAITSFAFEADPAGPNSNQKRYLVLFFDNASVSAADQINARSAAEKFVDANTGPNKFIAVANFSGTLSIPQNFTNDAERLKAVINGVKMSSVSTAGGGGGLPSLNGAATFGVRSVLLGLRSLAKALQDVPGRKSLVMLTAGFPLNSELQSELTATIDACNKSNVAVYPIDVRGLVAPGLMTPGMPGMPGGRGGRGGRVPMARLGAPGGGSSLLHPASFASSFAAPEQVRGGGSSGGTGAGPTAGGGSSASPGGSRTGGSSPGATSGAGNGAGSTGSRSSPGSNAPGSVGSRTGNTSFGTNAGRGGGSMPANPSVNNSLNNMRSIVPPMSPGLDGNQSVLYALAEGTGGFVIVNTNDLLGGMEKIAKEQNQYYILGYTPTESAEGSCHTLHVKVDRGGTNVRSRSGYCNVRQVDVLAGKPAETELESIAAGAAAGNIAAPLQVPFFYASPNVARVNVAMEIPTKSFKFEKVKGKLHSEMNVLGVAYRPDGSVGAKFSDTIKRDFENKAQVEEFAKKPLHYETQFDIATGQYNFKVVFSTGGESFGKLEKPLLIEPFDGKEFAVSALALSNELRKTEGDVSMDAILLEDRVPLVALGVQAVPAAIYRFKPTDSPGMYLEIFDPGLTGEKPPDVGVQIRVVDTKTGSEKMAAGPMALAKYVRAGNPLVPVLLRLPVQDLAPGSYRVDVTGLDSVGKSVLRSADFEID